MNGDRIGEVVLPGKPGTNRVTFQTRGDLKRLFLASSHSLSLLCNEVLGATLRKRFGPVMQTLKCLGKTGHCQEDGSLSPVLIVCFALSYKLWQ